MPRAVTCRCPQAIPFEDTENPQKWIHRSPQLLLTKDFLTVRRLSKGGAEIIRCRRCGRLNLVEETMGTCLEITPEDFPFIERWERTVYAPTPQQLEVLAKIGATPPDIYGNGSETIAIPCEGRIYGEPYITKMWVLFQKFPPIGLLHGSSPWRFITEVEDLQPSDFALSREVRKATTLADEIRMGFAPTIVRAPNGREYVLNWAPGFFWMDDVKGSELTLCHDSDDEFREKAYSLPDGRQHHLQIYVVIGDWSEDLLKLRI